MIILFCNTSEFLIIKVYKKYVPNINQRLYIYAYSAAGHGKGEADHVGGLAKVAIRRKIGAVSFFANSEEMVEFLNKKFGQKVNPVYYIKEIDVKQLEIA